MGIGALILVVGILFIILSNGVLAKTDCPNGERLPLYQYKDNEKIEVGFTDQDLKQSFFYAETGNLIYATEEGITLLEGCN